MTVENNSKSTYLGDTKKDSTHILGGTKKESNEFLIDNANPPPQQQFTKDLDITIVFNHAVNALLETVVINKENMTDWDIVDSGASIHFLVTGAPTSDMCLPMRALTVSIPEGDQTKTTINNGFVIIL